MRRAWLRMYGLMLLAMLLAGCLSVPPIELDPPIPDHWRNAGTDASAKSSVPGAWWKAFDDPRLDALVDMALQTNLDVAAAIEHLHAARLLDQNAIDPYLPNLHARTDDAVDPDASASFFVAGFDSLWEIGLFGQRASAKRVAKAQLDAATANVQGARVSLVAEVVRNWLELRSAQEQERVLSRIRDTELDRLRLMRIRQSNALSSTVELGEVEVALADAKAGLSEPRRSISTSMQRLAALVGRNAPDPAWLTPDKQPDLGSVRLASVPADLLRSRPEIVNAEANVLNAAGELGLSRAQMYPYIGLRAGIQWSTKITSDRPSPSRAVVSIGPVIDIPLLDWGIRVAKARAHGHEMQAALLTYRQSVLTGVAEVESALADLEQLRERVQAMQHAEQLAQRSAKLAAKRVELGVDSPLDRDALRITGDQRTLALIEARAQHDLAFVALHKALGGASALVNDEKH